MAASAFCLEFSKAQCREEEAEQNLVVWLSSENRIRSLRRPRQLEFVDKIAREESSRRFLQRVKKCARVPLKSLSAGVHMWVGPSAELTQGWE